MANLNRIEAVTMANPSGVLDICSHIIVEQKARLVISECIPYVGNYTFQFWVKGSSGYIILSCDEYVRRIPVYGKDEWSYFSCTFAVDWAGEDHPAWIELEMPKSEPNTEYWIYNMKLETGIYNTDWSPHKDDGNLEYDSQISEIKNTLLTYGFTDENTEFNVDYFRGQIESMVSSHTYSVDLGNINSKLEGLENGYGKWHVSIYDTSQFSEENKNRYDVGLLVEDGELVIPKSEMLVEDKGNLLNMSDVNRNVLYYMAFAHFETATTVTTNAIHGRITIYLNSMKVLESNEAGNSPVIFSFVKGWNLIEVVTNGSGFLLGVNLSETENCSIFNCLVGTPPVTRSAREISQSSSLKVALDGIHAKVETIVNSDSFVDFKQSILDMTSGIISAVVRGNNDWSSLTLSDAMIQAITNQFVVEGPNGSVIIHDGMISANSITSALLNVDAIKSINFSINEDLLEDEETTEPKYSFSGSFLDLANGNFYTPNLYLDTANNQAWFKGNGIFEGTVTSNDAQLGPWVINEEAIYKGSSLLGERGTSNAYFGDAGFSLSDALVYDASTDYLSLRVDSLSISGRDIYDAVSSFYDGNRIYYTDGPPTDDNFPMVYWKEEGTMMDHINDLCYDKNTGKVYRFEQTEKSRFKIHFAEGSTLMRGDYLAIYYVYNKVMRKIRTRIVGNEIGPFTIPSENFYIYWHSAGDTNNIYKFKVDSIEILSETAELSDASSCRSLPNYPVDRSFAVGRMPVVGDWAGERPDYRYDRVARDKIWFLRSGLGNVSHYGWIEIENAELKAAAEDARRAATYIHYDSVNGMILHNNIFQLPDGVLYDDTLKNIVGGNMRLKTGGMEFYNGNQRLASYSSITKFYMPDGVTSAVEIDASGMNIYKGTITIGENFHVTENGELTALSGTIGGCSIANGAIYSNDHDYYSSNERGFYFGSDGKLGIGDDSSFIRYDGESITMNVSSLSIGGADIGRAIEAANTAANDALIAAKNGEKTATNYLYYSVETGLVIHRQGSEIGGPSGLAGANVRLTADALDIYHGSEKLASYGSTTYFYGDGKEVVILNKDGLHISKGSMKIGNFQVNSEGDVVMNSGSIGGINVRNGAIYSGNKSYYNSSMVGFYMDCNGNFSLGGGMSYLKYDGYTLDFRGRLSANDGTIGGIRIANGAIYSGNCSSYTSMSKGFYFGSNGTLSVGGSDCYLKYDGKMVYLKGYIVATGGQIGPLKMKGDVAYTGERSSLEIQKVPGIIFDSEGNLSMGSDKVDIFLNEAGMIITGDICTLQLCSDDRGIKMFKGISKENPESDKLTLVFSADAGGNTYIAGDLTCRIERITSDERMKDIDRRRSVSDYKDLFMKIDPIVFRWKDRDRGKLHFGVGAQSVSSVQKELGYEGVSLVNQSSDGLLSVNYTELLMMSVPLVQDHEERIKELELENAILREKVGLLESILNKEGD